MVHVVSLVGQLTTTSIPLEIAATTANDTDVDVTVVSFYDDVAKTDYDVTVFCLGADSRFDVAAFRRLWQCLRRTDIDILHTHDNFIGSVARVLGTLAGIGIVNTEHRPHDSFTPLQNIVNVLTLPLADRVITNSKATKQSFLSPERLMIASHQLEVVYNGIDINRIESITKSRMDSTDGNGPQIITVGRMVDVKNQDLLLRAFASVLEQVPEASLVLVGDGPLRTELESRADSLGIRERVSFLGELPREEVYCQLAGSDIFAISSVAEGFCVAAVEAMACGLPVVATDIPVFHEVIGECGRFVDQDNPTQYAKELIELSTNPEERQALGIAAKERAKFTFPLKKTVEEHSKIYKDVGKTSSK